MQWLHHSKRLMFILCNSRWALTSSWGGKVPFWKGLPFLSPTPSPIPLKLFKGRWRDGPHGKPPPIGRLPASQQKQALNLYGSGLFWALPQHMIVSSPRWSGDTAFFSNFPLAGVIIEIFHPLSLETCNGSIIVKARCSFYAIQDERWRAFFATGIFGNYFKKRDKGNGSKITPIQCNDGAASINKGLGRVANYIWYIEVS